MRLQPRLHQRRIELRLGSGCRGGHGPIRSRFRHRRFRPRAGGHQRPHRPQAHQGSVEHPGTGPGLPLPGLRQRVQPGRSRRGPGRFGAHGLRSGGPLLPSSAGDPPKASAGINDHLPGRGARPNGCAALRSQAHSGGVLGPAVASRFGEGGRSPRRGSSRDGGGSVTDMRRGSFRWVTSLRISSRSSWRAVNRRQCPCRLSSPSHCLWLGQSSGAWSPASPD